MPAHWKIEYTDILNIGTIFDVQDKAEAIVNDMKDTIAKVTEATASIEEKPTALILESWDDTFTNYGSATLGGDTLTQLGGELANPDASSVGKRRCDRGKPGCDLCRLYALFRR